MASVTPTKKPKVQLIPWDPASPEHIQRLIQQRIACGWDRELVEGRWKASQESGEFNLQWIVLSDSDPSTAAQLNKHISTYPEDLTPLVDTALFYSAKPRTIPLPQRNFIPIGHICLGSLSAINEPLTSPFVDMSGLYWISNFYISRALQGHGLGSATLDTIESIATAEPLKAKTLALNAIDKYDPGREEKYEALGLPIPPFSNQEWYEKRGYRVYNTLEKAFSKVDSTGKTWYWNAVYLKKAI